MGSAVGGCSSRGAVAEPSVREGVAGAVQECPICLATTSDIAQLPHKSSTGDVSNHRACAKCREELLKRNAPCPWCRTEMVWQTVFSFLDGLKKGATGYMEGQHNQLADLMGTWQEYEMCRTKSDVSLFAKEMVSDPAITARLDGALAAKSGWLRDTAGLWIRFYGLYADGELDGLSHQDGARLCRAKDAAVAIFERSHGGHCHFVGAMYQQAVVAVLCANCSGLSTRSVAQEARKVGEAVMRIWERDYGTAHQAHLVRERLTKDFVQGVSALVWGDQPDPIMTTFY
mmetsp:Transcript_17547/g.39625  ORF Transcript_17547/g.39625 Transcript_17547/m.39625 type:complete len:287 (-) Transcript_17547:46-906(-)